MNSLNLIPKNKILTNNKINVIITIYFKTLIGRVAFCRCLRESAAGVSRHKQIAKNTHESLKESNKQARTIRNSLKLSI